MHTTSKAAETSDAALTLGISRQTQLFSLDLTLP